MKTLLRFSILSVSLACVSQAWAVVPDLIPVQGYLTDSDTGDPIDGATEMRFGIYGAQAGGSPLWESVYDSGTELVDVDHGYFSVYLGELAASPLDFFSLIDEPELWLQLTVNGEALDRIRAASLPFSSQAEYCTQVGDLQAGDIQPALGTPCEVGSYLRGWDSVEQEPICEEDRVAPEGTQYLNISGCDVVYEHDVDQPVRVTNNCEVYRTANSSYTNVLAPVHLPDGVTVTNLSAWAIDNNTNTNANVYVYLYRRTVTAGASAASMSTMGGAVTSSASANIQMLEDTTISYATIDNVNYDYNLIITLGNTTSYYADMSFFKVRIAYVH